ncbi:MAG: long-chain fatty acid transporter [Gammaproteobacteria bacterium]|jgi:long-chain fatty acid transport protein|nr:long-chain fatty acid transporter [Gammaproteobacteria bacterium]
MKKKLSCLIILCSMQAAHAANFQLFEQSATLLGQADAGTAVSDDPSVQFYNPAATAFFDKTNIGISAIYIDPKVSYTVNSATNLDGAPISGPTPGPGQTAIAPGLFLIQPINNRVTLGLGVTVPFGLSTSYGAGSPARYFATESKIETVNINPSVAYKFTDKFSAGLGLDFQYMHATLNQAVDAENLTLLPVNDIYLQNNAFDWGHGWNGGLYYQPFNTTKLGLSYRSQVVHHLNGTSSPDMPGGIDPIYQDLLAYYGIQNSNVYGTIVLPPYTTLSAQQDLTPRWSIMADAEYIQWNKIQDVTLNFSPKSGGPQGWTLPSTTIPLHYSNTWRLSLGQSYKITDKLTGRMGVASDASPVSPEYATARIPDSDRYWLTLGAGYAFTPNASLNIGYAHIFFDDSSTNQSQTFTNSGVPIGTITYAANYRAEANLFGAQFNAKFG